MPLKYRHQLGYFKVLRVFLCFDFLFLKTASLYLVREEPESVISGSYYYNLLTSGTLKVMKHVAVSQIQCLQNCFYLTKRA